VNRSQTIKITLEDLGMEKLENNIVVDKFGDVLKEVMNSAEKGDSVSFDILSEIKKAIGSN
jgi:N-acetylglucosamine kinase-like BadF-type ATPase